MKISARLAILIALSLLIGTWQCVTACTPVDTPQPVCHHHKKAPASPNCSQELVAANPATVLVDAALVPVATVQTSQFADIFIAPAEQTVPTLTDPRPPLPTVLRI